MITGEIAPGKTLERDILSAVLLGREYRGKSVTVGFSGGIDSTAAVLLMKRIFSHVEAITMWLYDGQERDFDSIRTSAERLDVPHRLVDFRTPFRSLVIEKYVEMYESGLTPNPCMICNRHIKYRLLPEFVRTDYLATGHYAVLAPLGKEWTVFRSPAERKDQSYNLYSLGQEQLRRLLFPLSVFRSKREVTAYVEEEFRRLGEKGDSVRAVPVLPRESMGTCFLEGKTVPEFFRKRGSGLAAPGCFADREGNILGVHQGIVSYTVGQKPKIRKNVPVDGMTSPYHVLGVVTGFDTERNIVILGDEEDVKTSCVTLGEISILTAERRRELLRDPVSVTIRLSQWSETRSGTARIEIAEGEEILVCRTDFPMRAPAPGQIGVLYRGEELIGGGVIRTP